MHTHLNENKDEIEVCPLCVGVTHHNCPLQLADDLRLKTCIIVSSQLAKELHEKDSYLDIYAHAGLLGPKSVFAHCVHMNDLDYDQMVSSKSVAAFCPTSNLFLGRCYSHSPQVCILYCSRLCLMFVLCSVRTGLIKPTNLGHMCALSVDSSISRRLGPRSFVSVWEPTLERAPRSATYRLSTKPTRFLTTPFFINPPDCLR